MEIRAFRSSDAQAVNRVALASFEQYGKVFSDWDTVRGGVAVMAELAASADIIVAEAGGQVVGAVAYCAPHSTPRAEFFEADWPIIRMLVVEPGARGRGIGRKLSEACVERARADGATLISLHTSPAMAVALAMYLRMGFKLARRVPDRFGVPYAVYTLDL